MLLATRYASCEVLRLLLTRCYPSSRRDHSMWRSLVHPSSLAHLQAFHYRLVHVFAIPPGYSPPHRLVVGHQLASLSTVTQSLLTQRIGKRTTCLNVTQPNGLLQPVLLQEHCSNAHHTQAPRRGASPTIPTLLRHGQRTLCSWLPHCSNTHTVYLGH